MKNFVNYVPAGVQMGGALSTLAFCGDFRYIGDVFRGEY